MLTLRGDLAKAGEPEMRQRNASEGIEELKALRNGRRVCIVCDTKLRGEKRVLCGDDECRKAYHRIRSADTLLKRSWNDTVDRCQPAVVRRESMPPTIGRIVHVRIGDQTLPAIVTRVHSEKSVNVRVFGDDDEIPEHLSSVVQGTGDLQWQWPNVTNHGTSPKAE